MSLLNSNNLYVTNTHIERLASQPRFLGVANVTNNRRTGQGHMTAIILKKEKWNLHTGN
jgi:hypothetical protein